MNKNTRSDHIPICAGIVSYNPDISRFLLNIYAIKSQVDFIVIVDNGSSNIKELRYILNSHENIFIIENTGNKGIAQALNQIFIYALKHGFLWVLTLDQDTICADNLIKTYKKHLNTEKVGILCPKVIYEGTDLTKEANREIEFIDACMTSGSLTSVESWHKCNGFDEWMFIDLVDNDYCMRLKVNKYKVIRVNSATIRHQLGNQETINLPFGINVVIYNHSPLRNYYYVRNSVYYIRKYRKNSNVIHLIGVLIYWEGKKLIFEKSKIKIINSIIKGLRDGMNRKLI